MGNVQISPNLKRTKVNIDQNGNTVDPRTKQIVVPVEAPYVPSSEDLAAVSAKTGGETPMAQSPATEAPRAVETPPITGSIKEQIEAAKKLLVQLEEARKAEIAEMKRKLAELENE